MTAEIIDIQERRKKASLGVYACGSCGCESWNLWTDHRVTCAECGAMAENVQTYKDPLPVGA